MNLSIWLRVKGNQVTIFLGTPSPPPLRNLTGFRYKTATIHSRMLFGSCAGSRVLGRAGLGGWLGLKCYLALGGGVGGGRGDVLVRLVCQDSCACTRFLRMRNTLVHAQHSFACTGGARDQCRDPNKALAQAGPPSLFVGSRPWSLAPPVHAQECCACTRTLCMHKNRLCRHNSCVDTRILFAVT